MTDDDNLAVSGKLLPDQPAFVNKELDDINAVFDPKLCVEILLLNCDQHPGSGDETLCGTNGVTYANQ